MSSPALTPVVLLSQKEANFQKELLQTIYATAYITQWSDFFILLLDLAVRQGGQEGYEFGRE
jgi:hypothetical protein